ncbi:MAG TPA: FMN-binding protein [Bryobacteraceae bacterium]|nr:FMN-binding protein [Bryobacteraceae bacterium]
MNPSAPTSSGFPMVRTLTTVSLLCGLLIVVTEVNTRVRIRHNQETIMQESIAQLLPGVQKQIIYQVEPSGDLTIASGLQGEGRRLFAGYDAGGRFLGVVIEAADRGYADVISAMYAYDPDKKIITGFKVVDMRETPGLGSRIQSDPEFIANFKELDASEEHPITAVKHGTKKNAWEIDAISGATISSRAVGRALQASVQATTPIVARNLDRIKRGQ